MDRISIVVPCFNEEEALPVYYREMKHVMGELSEVSFEILFVDDGSSDKTLEILKGRKMPVSFLFQKLWKRSSYIRGA